jgi:hypothetical protein
VLRGLAEHRPAQQDRERRDKVGRRAIRHTIQAIELVLASASSSTSGGATGRQIDHAREPGDVQRGRLREEWLLRDQPAGDAGVNPLLGVVQTGL